MNHGGKRQGSGRKAGGHNKTPARVIFTMRLSPDVLAALRSRIPAGKRSQFIEKAITESLSMHQA